MSKIKNNKNKIAIIVIVAAFFGLASGIIGEMVARTSLVGQAWRVPFFGEINFQPTNGLGSPNLIIRDARKVVVEQNTKINETIKASQNSLVGIFKKKEIEKPLSVSGNAKPREAVSNFNFDDYYRLDQPLAIGFILTSDGWIMSGWLPGGIKIEPKQIKAVEAATSTANQYVIITRDRKIYSVKKIIVDPVTSYSFWQAEVRDWPVKKIADDREIKAGQLAVAVNWQGQSLVTTINGWRDSGGIMRSSEEYSRHLLLVPAAEKDFQGYFLFNLNNELVGLINQKGDVLTVGNFFSIIKSLLKTRKIARPYLGARYVVLDNLVPLNKNSDNFKGVLIYADNKPAVASGSPAALAGLRAGDIITAVNNITLNNEYDLAAAVADFSPGDEIDITYSRQGREEILKVKLGKK